MTSCVLLGVVSLQAPSHRRGEAEYLPRPDTLKYPQFLKVPTSLVEAAHVAGGGQPVSPFWGKEGQEPAAMCLCVFVFNCQ